MARKASKALLVLTVHPEARAQPVLRDQPDHLVHQDLTEKMAPMGCRGRWVRRARLALREQPVHKVPRVPQAPRVPMETMAIPVRPVRRVHLDQRALLAQPDRPDQLVLKVLLGQWVLPAWMVKMVIRGLQDRLVPRVQLVHPVRLGRSTEIYTSPQLNLT